MRRGRFAIRLAILGVSILLGAACALMWLREETPPAWLGEYDVTASEPQQIAPGTVIGRGAPDGWSHLIIKSLPRVKPSEAARVPVPPFLSRERVLRQASWMFTVFAANVVQERQGRQSWYRLRAVGLGLGASVNGQDIVLNADGAQPAGVSLNFIESETLRAGYRVQRQSRLAVHASSFALVDTPVAFRCGTKNRMVRFRYALLVDMATGELDVFCWRLGGTDGECADLSRAVLLPPSDIDDAELIPDATEFTAGVPNELGFGVDELPPHRLEVTIPAGLRGLAAQKRFTPDEARTLQNGLRKLLP